MSLASLLRQRATILRPPVSQTTAGGPDRTGAAAVLADGVPCLVRPRGASLLAFLGRRDDQRAETVDARIYFAGDPLAPADELTARCRIVVDGRTYSVNGVSDVNSMDRLLHVDCERLR